MDAFIDLCLRLVIMLLLGEGEESSFSLLLFEQRDEKLEVPLGCARQWNTAVERRCARPRKDKVALSPGCDWLQNGYVQAMRNEQRDD